MGMGHVIRITTATLLGCTGCLSSRNKQLSQSMPPNYEKSHRPGESIADITGTGNSISYHSQLIFSIQIFVHPQQRRTTSVANHCAEAVLQRYCATAEEGCTHGMQRLFYIVETTDRPHDVYDCINRVSNLTNMIRSYRRSEVLAHQI
jgi:hypothetical protein